MAETNQQLLLGGGSAACGRQSFASVSAEQLQSVETRAREVDSGHFPLEIKGDKSLAQDGLPFFVLRSRRPPFLRAMILASIYHIDNCVFLNEGKETEL